MINTVQQALEDVYVALGGQEDIDRLTVSQVLAKIYNVLGGTGDHGDETVPQLIDLIATVAPSGGGGGGGDGDFSVATVTMINNSGTALSVEAASYFEEDGERYSIGSLYAEPGETTISPVILYKGSAYGYVLTNPPPSMTSSGNIEIEEGSDWIITGDGTVTISE